MTPTPHSRTTGVAPPSSPIASRCAATSSAAVAPLSARSRPPSAARGRHQPASRSSGATARAVTMSTGATVPAAPVETRAAGPVGGAPASGPPTHSSARARSTVTAPVRPSVVTASARKAVRRASGSTSTTVRSGRATASTIPGKPAPDPTSAIKAPKGINSATAAQLSRCRLQTRGASRGPTRPRITPSVASRSAYAAARGRRSPKSRSAAGLSFCGRTATGPGDDVPPGPPVRRGSVIAGETSPSRGRRRRPQTARSGGRAATDRRAVYRPVKKAPNARERSERHGFSPPDARRYGGLARRPPTRSPHRRWHSRRHARTCARKPTSVRGGPARRAA
jgi:hypothetical protein